MTPAAAIRHALPFLRRPAARRRARGPWCRRPHRPVPRALLLVALAGPLGLPGGSALAQEFDVLIRNGRVLDGSGNPWRRADVGIRGDRIVAVGDLREARARRIVDAADLYIAPGFLDTHSHAASGLATPELSGARPLLAQGITTVLANPDGGGPADLRTQRDSLLRDGLGVNVARFVPHGSVRRAVLGMEDRPATDEEVHEMARLVRAGMEAGAVGLSSGLFYAPGSYAPLEEVIALARIAAEYGGAYQSHIRDESDYTIGVLAAVEEVITVARDAGLPGVVTHVKALGPPVWGFSTAIVRRIEAARAAGVPVYADQYPYTASGTSIVGALVPRWALAGGAGAFRRRVADPETWGRLRADMAANLARRGGADRLLFQGAGDGAVEGRTLAEVAAARGLDPIEAALAILEEGGPAGLISFNMDERDVRTLMRQPWTMTASDGELIQGDRGRAHPRSYGTFPRKIRTYVLEEGVVGLADAVRGMTSLPAGVFGLADRGWIRPGAAADVVVFDLERLTDRATYEDPHQLAEGVVHLLVNGTFAIDGSEFTGALAGRVLDRGEPGRESGVEARRTGERSR